MTNPLSFLHKFSPGIYRIALFFALEGDNLDPEYQTGIENKLSRLEKFPHETYFKTPQDFFSSWIERRFLDDQLSRFCYGFELQQLTIDTTSYSGGLFSQINGLVLASDLAYTSDFGHDFIFVLNDVTNKRVLTYHDEEGKHFAEDPRSEKLLIEKPVYDYGGEPNKYPFESLNTLKSIGQTWSLINIPLEEVYKALRNIGFKW